MVMRSILRIIKDGRQVNFERFSCKTAAGVISQYKKIADNSLWGFFLNRDYKTADAIVIQATPDGYNGGDELARYTPAEFFKQIGFVPDD